MTAPVEARIDPASFAKLLADVKAFDAALSRALRKRLRLAAVDAVAEVRKTLEQPTPAGRPMRPDGVRADLAASTRVAILAGQRAAGVRIVTTSAKLDAAHKAMLKAYNKPHWRHPIRGHKSARWVNQAGRPYFGAVIGARKAAMATAVEAALVEARSVIR